MRLDLCFYRPLSPQAYLCLPLTLKAQHETKPTKARGSEQPAGRGRLEHKQMLKHSKPNITETKAESRNGSTGCVSRYGSVLNTGTTPYRKLSTGRGAGLPGRLGKLGEFLKASDRGVRRELRRLVLCFAIATREIPAQFDLRASLTVASGYVVRLRAAPVRSRNARRLAKKQREVRRGSDATSERARCGCCFCPDESPATTNNKASESSVTNSRTTKRGGLSAAIRSLCGTLRWPKAPRASETILRGRRSA